MRLSIIVLACLWTTSANAQTPSELQSMFGNPENGVYIVNPEASLSVTNGSDGRACHLALEPRDPQKGLSTEIASRILNEIVPMNTRRGKPLSAVTYLSCVAQETQAYRNVTISTTTIDCKRKVQHLTITWRRPPCGN